jgi:hypothetical protein
LLAICCAADFCLIMHPCKLNGRHHPQVVGCTGQRSNRDPCCAHSDHIAAAAIPSLADHIVNTIGEFSRGLGNAAKCDPWAVEIFAEEVVRGGPAFAISLIISAIEPTLRQLAELGAWQVRRW